MVDTCFDDLAMPEKTARLGIGSTVVGYITTI